MIGAMAFAGLNAGSDALDWNNITGSLDAENNNVVMPYSTSLTVGLSGVSGSGQISYEINEGGPLIYGAPFAVTVGQQVKFSAQTKGTYSATVTVTRTGGAVVDTFTVNLV